MATSVSNPALLDSEESSLRYSGWRVVSAAQIAAFVSFASLMIYTFSIFLKPLTAEFGWSREAVSRAFAIAALTVAACSPFLGRILDRVDPRRVLLPCIAVFGIAFASLSLLTPSLLHFYLVFFVIGIVGNGTTQMALSRPVASWFNKRRGTALALVMCGVGAGSIVLPIVAQRLIETFGWRTAYAILGAMVLVLGLPLTAKFVRNRDGERFTQENSETGNSFAEALRSRAFWILVATLFLSSVSVNGAVTHLAALLTDRGIGVREAALAASVLGGASLTGRLISGWFLDRFWGPAVSCVLLFLMAGGVALLSRSNTIEIGMVAAVLIGLGMGGEADVTPLLLSRYFGLRSFSALYGLTWTFYAVAGALGPVILGRFFDTSGSYGQMFDFLAIPVLLSAMLMLWMPRYPATA